MQGVHLVNKLTQCQFTACLDIDVHSLSLGMQKELTKQWALANRQPSAGNPDNPNSWGGQYIVPRRVDGEKK